MTEPEKRDAGETPPSADADAPAIGRISLTTEGIEAVAVGTWDETMAGELLIGEWSRNMLLFRYILGEGVKRPDVTGPLAPLAEVNQLLQEAESVNAAAVRDLLLRPTVGQWMGDAVRRLRSTSDDDPRPLWADLGYIHTIAAVAAQKTGIDATVRVPSFDEQVVLPTLGRATLPPHASGWRTTEISTGNGFLMFSNEAGRFDMPDQPNEDAPGWDAARWLALAADHKKWDVLLDDLDHFTSLRTPIIPERLSPEAAEQWREVLGQAWEALVAHHPAQAQQIAGQFGVKAIVPLAPEMRFRLRNITSGDSPLSVAMSRPQDPIEAAVGLVQAHCGHNVLNTFQHLFPLFVPQEELEEYRAYVPLQDQPRHPVALMHDAKAFCEAAKFWQQRLEVDTGTARDVAAVRFLLSRNAAYIAGMTLSYNDESLTDHGITFLNHIGEGVVTPLLEVPVSSAIDQRVYVAKLDHALRWNAHHVPFAEEALDGVAEAWRAEQPVPVTMFETPPDLDPNEAARGLDITSVLLCLGLLDPGALDRPELLPAETTAGDITLVKAIMQLDATREKGDALEQMMSRMLQAHENAPYGALTAAYERIATTQEQPPNMQDVADWLAKSMIAHMRH
jgi:HEXXH motif-containing protein